MKPKYLTPNNGYWVYQRRVPEDVLGHPYWNSKRLWKQPLNLPVDSPTQDVLARWQELHDLFEDALNNVRERNPHILQEREWRKKAEVHLKMFKLEPSQGSIKGARSDSERKQKSEMRDWAMEATGAFQQLQDWDSSQRQTTHYKETGEYPEQMPNDVRIQNEAWVMFTEPTSKKAPIAFGDLWPLYEKGKSLDMDDRNNKNKKVRWQRFFDVVGDDVVTGQSITDGLREWRNQQRSRSVKDQTVKKELNGIIAVINYAKSELGLLVDFIRPKIDIKTEEYERPTITPENLHSIWNSITDESLRIYQPWKEFILTILCQSSAILSEVMRIERTDIRLDAQTPHINLYDTELKTKDRKRIVPLPFRTERLKQLLEVMDHGQDSALPPTIVKKADHGWEWVTSESNINHQLNKYFRLGDLEDFGYTTYSTRHSFKLYLQIAGVSMMDMAYLGGWSGDTQMSRMLKHYGQHGIGAPEMVKRLEVAVSKSLHFLDQDRSNIVSLYRA